MSYKVAARVWEHSQHRGTTKLLLLAFAEFASDNGICWPSAATLATRINETERYTRILIKELVSSGDLVAVPGGGRGKTTRYGVMTGLPKKERDRLNTVLQNSVLQNSDHDKTVISGDENSVLQCQETVISGDERQSSFTALAQPKTAQIANDNRHIEPSLEPSLETLRASRAPPMGKHQQLMAAYQEALGYKIPNAAKEAPAAKKILAAGYTVEQVLDVYQRLKTGFWSDKHLSLHKVYEEIGAQLAAPKAGTNGTHQPKGHSNSQRRRNGHIPERLDGG
jgi:hypothetical protein